MLVADRIDDGEELVVHLPDVAFRCREEVGRVDRVGFGRLETVDFDLRLRLPGLNGTADANVIALFDGARRGFGAVPHACRNGAALVAELQRQVGVAALAGAEIATPQ